VVAFQLCYDRLNHERVLAWNESGGFIHRRIDDGEGLPVQKMSPIMVADGEFPGASIAAEFDSRSAPLDARWRGFISTKIGEAETQLSASPKPA
jgi:hypothetical protein